MQQRQAGSVEDLWGVTVEAFHQLQITHLLYVYCRGYLNTPEDTILLTTMPGWWVEKYQREGYAAFDPFFTYCCQTYEPVRTGVEYLPDYTYLNEKERGLITEAAETGFRSGTSCIVRRRGLGPDFGGWNLGTTLSRNDFESMYKSRSRQLRLLSLHAHERITLLTGRDQEEVKEYQEQTLSERQIECLTLLSKGRRTKEIASELEIQPVTVEHHINLAKKFLNSTTREQAIARAVIKGIIEVN
ncbi:MAG: LuxR family transcriptional regulator [Pseudomonadota bacterium]